MKQPSLLPDAFGLPKENKLRPIIKWAGGKSQELNIILPNLPSHCDRYIEPFVGGGAVFFSINCEEKLINDRSDELISVYRLVQKNTPKFFDALYEISKRWQYINKLIDDIAPDLLIAFNQYSSNKVSLEDFVSLTDAFVESYKKEFLKIVLPPFAIDKKRFINELKKNILNKIKRMKIISQQRGDLSDENIFENFETAIKSALYMYFRFIYNRRKEMHLEEEVNTAIFYFIREYCYSSMFRYNSNGEFNVPYGGLQYNRKDFFGKIQSLQSQEYQEHLYATKIFNLDFETFLKKVSPKANDFIFIDPPYDTEFNTYAENSFTVDDQIRLANHLEKTRAKFLMIVKNTQFISDLYMGNGYHTQAFEKRYLVSFMDRNNKEAEHLMVTNYSP